MYHLWCLMDFPLALFPQLSGETAGLIRWFICTFPPAVMDGTSTFPWNFIISQLQPLQPHPPTRSQEEARGREKKTSKRAKRKKKPRLTSEWLLLHTSRSRFWGFQGVWHWTLRSNLIAFGWQRVYFVLTLATNLQNVRFFECIPMMLSMMAALK